MTKEIPLTRGLVAIVDDDVYEWATRWKWHALRSKKTWRPMRTEMVDGKKRGVLLAREIMNAPEGVPVDHINGNGLDNRRANLRCCTTAENNRNRRAMRGVKYKGVTQIRNSNRWRARVYFNNKPYHYGTFDTPEEAARAYDRGARELFGEFAKTNFND